MNKDSSRIKHSISKYLTQWYEVNKRDLPWRHTDNPYFIWISEIILQQTRVSQGYEYYLKFTQRYPLVSNLANANEDEVMKLWEGLGYYSRARNLHEAAKTITNQYNGIFPHNYNDIISLKGIGEYTAAAIASFAFNQPYAVVDGNVFRVISRVFDIEEAIDTTIGKKIFSKTAQDILAKDTPALHNQAIMEFGALHCTPTSPKCDECPISDQCFAYANNTVAIRPVKRGKVKIKNRYFNYFFVQKDSHTYINKRTTNDIWKNLYELPLIETENVVDIETLLCHNSFKEIFPERTFITSCTLHTKHILSHQRIFTNFYKIEIENDDILSSQYIKIDINDLDKYAMPRLIQKYLEDIKII